MVRIPVEIPTNLLPNNSVVNVVARAEAEILTMLFPIKIVLKSLPGFSVTCKTFAALLLPSSANVFSLILLTVVRAVSDEEKNAESNNRTISTTN